MTEGTSRAISAGFAMADITAPAGTVFLGHSPRQQHFTGVADPMRVRAAVFSGEVNTVVLVVCDLLAVGRVSSLFPHSLGAVIRREISNKTGIPDSHVLVAATHAHSTPETSGITDVNDDLTVGWMAGLAAIAADAVLRATADAAPAELATHSLRAPGIGVIRRKRGPSSAVRSFASDDSVTILVARRAGRRPIVLVNFACHPVLLQAQPLVSADFPGQAMTVLADEGVDGLFLQGAAGDVNPIAGDAGTVNDIRRDGIDLAYRVLEGIARSVVDTDLTLNAATVEIDVGKRSAPDISLAAELAGRADRDAQDLLSRLGDVDVPWRTQIQAFRIGSTVIVALPGEPVTALGVIIKAISPSHRTMIAGYANDYLGYLVPPWDWLDGGYEVSAGPWSLVSADAVILLLQQAIDLAERLWSGSILSARGADNTRRGSP